MFITIEHRNLEIRKHVTTSCSGTKPFYYFWVKGFDIRTRDTIFYAVLFIWPPSRADPIGCKFASRLRAPNVDPARLASSIQLSSFLQISHKSPRASGTWRHPHPVTPFRHLGLLWHLGVARPPPTYIKVFTKLTHVLSRKVLSLTKLKGMNPNPLVIKLQIYRLSSNDQLRW